MTVYQKLANVQAELKAPKNQRNDFGKYNYRNCEDILEAAKPLCIENGLLLTVCDSLKLIGERYYIEATAKVVSIEDNDRSTLKFGSDLAGRQGAEVCNTAYAREEENKKGMDASQITGAASSYARKYALNGLFCIDDTKDADSMDNTKTHITDEQKARFDMYKENQDALRFFLLARAFGQDVYTAYYNSAKKDKMKFKSACDELEKKGVLDANEIIEDVKRLIGNDDPAWREELDGLQPDEKKSIYNMFDKKTQDKMKEESK